MQSVTIYSDGACSGNPGCGGWGAILICKQPYAELELSGAEHDTTNNRMELTAVVQALKKLKKPCHVKIVTDSKYVINAFQQNWIENWKRNGWKTADKKPVKNMDLWKELIDAVKPHQLTWQWIRGHSGHPENERADQLAVKSRENLANYS